MLAEYIKSQRIQLSCRTKNFLEYGIPCFSLSCLLGVTIYVTISAVEIIYHPSNAENVNVYFLYGFASGNLFIDIFCGLLFCYKGNIYTTNLSPPLLSNDSMTNDINIKRENSDVVDICLEDDNNTHNKRDQSNTRNITQQRKNMNMMSALAHVIGDSMRTMSVFIAATVSVTKNINADICDAWAAILVSITILIMITNVLYELYKSYLVTSSETLLVAAQL